LATVRILRSTTAGNTPSSLVSGQIAINEGDGKLFYRNGSGVVTALPTGLAWSSVPASATSNGTVGQIAFDNSHFYVAVGTNQWERAALSKWPLVSLSYFLVGGGGGGGAGRGGGGGGGGVVSSTRSVELGESLSVVVGSGGAPATSGGAPATSGSNSSLALPNETLVALGGGYGADGLSGLVTGTGMAGGSGGSGGGGSGYPPAGLGGAGTVGQGFAGGAGNGSGEPYNGGSGGGAGGVGSSASGGSGGVGMSDAFLVAASAGEIVDGAPYVGGGGGSGTYQNTPGSGGAGGGGGGGNTSVAGTAGAAGTGGGGGGGGNAANGGAGGSGLVILRVADTLQATTTGSPTVYVTGGFRYYKFTQNGTISLEFAPVAPAAPTGLTATAGNAQASLSWTAPSGVAASVPITDYAVQFSTNGGSTWTTATDTVSTATSATLTGLTNESAYVFRVAAINSVGTGAYSTASRSVTPAVFTLSGLRLWLDASDAGTLFDATSGGSLVAADGGVARWEDKSGTGNHATQATSGSRPLRKLSNQNGLAGLQLDGTDDFLSATIAGFQSLTATTIVIVAKPTAAAAADTNAGIFCAFGNTGSASSPYPSNSGLLVGHSTGLFSGEYLAIGVDLSGTAGRLGSSSYRRSASQAVAIVATLSESGTQVLQNNSEVTLDLASGATDSTNSSPAQTGYTVDNALHLGAVRASGGITGFAAMTFHQVLVYDRVLSAGEQTNLWNYLSQKWGIA